MPSKKKGPFHPGEILYSMYLEPLGLSQKQFAEHLGWTYTRLNEIINQRRGVTADSALAFGEALGMEPEFWLHTKCNGICGVLERHTPASHLLRKKAPQTHTTEI